MDTLGAGLAYLITGLTLRQSLWFFTGCTIKTVLDHSGYEFPWDPLQLVFSNNAAYHDIHHQSWGIKTNFSQPFFIFWDRLGGTMFVGDAEAKYERARRAAALKMAQDNVNSTEAPPESIPAVITGAEIDEPAQLQPRVTRKKSSSISGSPAGNLKGLRNKVNDSLQGRGANVLGVERSR